MININRDVFEQFEYDMINLQGIDQETFDYDELFKKKFY